MKGLKCIVILLAMSLLLVSCGGNVDINIGNESEEPKEDITSSSDEPEKKETKIDYRFADQEEGVSLKLGNTEYFESFSQNDMDYRAQKKGATLEDVTEFTAEQVLEFSGEEKQAVDGSIHLIESILNENGYVLPEMDEIVFVRTTMLEEGEALAYTHKTEIYLGDHFLEGLRSEDEAVQRQANATMCHEIFHCLTRNNPQFRKDMYSIINFTVTDEDFEMGPAIREMYYSNPDVDRHNSYITLTINGEKKDCFMVFGTSKAFEEEGDRFTDSAKIMFVPVDDTNTYYQLSADGDPEEFFDMIGRNTGYAIDPEECMADNFGDALIYGRDSREGQPYESPEIIDKILDYLRK